MADWTDVETALANIIGAAIYPNGIGSPSAIANATAVRIDRGWPVPATLDADIAAGIVEVTIFPMPGTAGKVYQLLDATYTVTPAAVNTTATLSGNTVTVTGPLAVGEFLTVIADGAYVYSATGASVAAMLASLAQQAQVNYPTASSTATTLTIPAGRSMLIRQGGVGTQGKVIWRQKQAVRVSVWAPTDATRTAVAIAVDLALKKNIKITLPDTSQAIVTYSRMDVFDDRQKSAIYRRDLVYDVEYAAVQLIPGTTITSTQTSTINVSAYGTAPAIIATT